jgi:hypothetical protein
METHKTELASLNTKVHRLYNKWLLVRASTLDDWSKISSNPQYHNMRYERHEFVHGGDVTTDTETIQSFPVEAERLEVWKKAFFVCYGVPCILNKRASAHTMTIFQAKSNRNKNLGPRIIQMANEVIKSYFDNKETRPFQPGSRTRFLYDRIEALWNERSEFDSATQWLHKIRETPPLGTI